MGSTPRHRIALGVVLAVYSVALAVALLAPNSHDQSEMVRWVRRHVVAAGVDRFTFTYARAEFLANVVILAPVSALGSLVWTRTTWRDWTAYAFAIAAAVELIQGLLLPDRFPSTADVVANALGGLLGSVVVAIGRRTGQLARRGQG